jgi:hypothetical protein
MARHLWIGVSREHQMVRNDEQLEAEIAANHSRYDEHAIPIRTRASDRPMRLAPLRQRERVRVGKRSIWWRLLQWLRQPRAFKGGPL